MNDELRKRGTSGKVLVAAMVAVIPAYLIGSDLFFRSQVAAGALSDDASARVLPLASAGFMRERRSLSLVCSKGSEAKLLLKAKLAEKAFLKIGETAPATFAFRSGNETIASVDAQGTVVANGFVETVATAVLDASQLKQISSGLTRASDVQVTAIGRGVSLGIDTTAREAEDFIARCGSAPGKQSQIPRSKNTASWPGLSRPSTSLLLAFSKDVDARDIGERSDAVLPNGYARA